MSTTLAMTAASAPAYVELPESFVSLQRLWEVILGHNSTFEDGVDRCKVGADRDDDHGQGETEQLDDDMRGDGGGDV